MNYEYKEHNINKQLKELIKVSFVYKCLLLNGNSYQIGVESNCFIPYKLGVSKIGKDTKPALCYCTKLSNAVQAIIRDSMADIDETISLLEYVERYELALKDCKTFVDF